MTLVNIRKYEYLWELGEISKPILIVISGAAGTGKSTIASAIAKNIRNINTLVTPLIRSMLTNYVTMDANPYIYQHTFDLCNDCDGFDVAHRAELLWERFLKQSEPINAAIRTFTNFLSSEKQHYIIEGSNVLPAYSDLRKNLVVIELCMKATDEKMHKKLMGGPTHNRKVSKERLLATRLLQKQLLSMAKKESVTDFEYNTDLNVIYAMIDSSIKEQLNF